MIRGTPPPLPELCAAIARTRVDARELHLRWPNTHHTMCKREVAGPVAGHHTDATCAACRAVVELP